jgi:hypothetical protein
MLGRHVWTFSLTVSVFVPALGAPDAITSTVGGRMPWLVSLRMASTALVTGLDCEAPRVEGRDVVADDGTMEGQAMVRLAGVR